MHVISLFSYSFYFYVMLGILQDCKTLTNFLDDYASVSCMIAYLFTKVHYLFV